jgi:hypothetical protein
MNENEFPKVVSNQKKQPEQTTRELILPRPILIFESLSNSIYKLACAVLITIFDVALAIFTYKLATGDISTDIYVKLAQLLLETLQNLVLANI